MTIIERTARRLRRRAVVAPPETVLHDPQADELPASVCKALEAAEAHERPGADERRPRLVVSIPGKPMFLDGDASTADQLKARFPEIKTTKQADTAARFLREVLRARKRIQRQAQGGNWATSW